MKKSFYINLGKAMAYLKVAEHDIENGISNGTEWIAFAHSELDEINLPASNRGLNPASRHPIPVIKYARGVFRSVFTLWVWRTQILM